MILKTTLLSIFLISTISIFSQDYFITGKNDTTFCSNLKYATTGQGYLKTLTYTSTKGIEVKFKGRKKVPDVVTLYIDSVTIDRVPSKAHKPNSYVRFIPRAVDGKLKVYSSQPRYNTNRVNRTNIIGVNTWEAKGPTGIYRFYIKMPDGTFYKINSKKNMRKYIKPFLLKCTKFKNQYKGDFSTREKPFMEMIELYNSLCE